MSSDSIVLLKVELTTAFTVPSYILGSTIILVIATSLLFIVKNIPVSTSKITL